MGRKSVTSALTRTFPLGFQSFPFVFLVTNQHSAVKLRVKDFTADV